MLIKCKAPAENASGKQGEELVYGSWRGQQVARNYARPSNPQTAYQTAIRATLTTLAQRWKTLTLPQREAWALYTRTYPIINRLGNPVVQTALSAYIQQNQVHQLISGTSSFVDDAPTSGRPAGLTSANGLLVNDVNSISVTVVHGYTTLTGLWVMVKSKYLTSVAQNPSMRACALISGTNSASTAALVTSGTAITITDTRQDAISGDTWSVYLQVVNADGQQSQPILVKEVLTD